MIVSLKWNIFQLLKIRRAFGRHLVKQRIAIDWKTTIRSTPNLMVICAKTSREECAAKLTVLVIKMVARGQLHIIFLLSAIRCELKCIPQNIFQPLNQPAITKVVNANVFDMAKFGSHLVVLH